MRHLLDQALFNNDTLRRLLPTAVKQWLKSRMAYADLRSRQLRQEAERRLGGPIPTESDYSSPHDLVLGILADNGYGYTYNIAACRELQVRFRVVDIMSSDWLARVRESGCDNFLVTPPSLLGLWHQIFNERLSVMSQTLRLRLCPSYDELFFWNSKRRTLDWLSANKVPHPATWCFLDRSQALAFCRQASYPIVCKTDGGASSSGVFVVRDRRAAQLLVRQAFSSGILARTSDARDREWGNILFQAYVPHEYEWRIVRIGGDFMCRRKERAGDFASGSGKIGWAAPPAGMLDFVRQLTDRAGFSSMAVDLFEGPVGSGERPFLVNELQAIFGAIKHEANLNEHAGRWRYLPSEGRWTFEPGFFYQNACANLRVQMLLADHVRH